MIGGGYQNAVVRSIDVLWNLCRPLRGSRLEVKLGEVGV